MTHDTDEDEQEALAVSDCVQVEIRQVVERWQAKLPPRSGQFLVLYALANEWAQQMLDAIEDNPERARPWSERTLAHVSLVVASTGQRPH